MPETSIGTGSGSGIVDSSLACGSKVSIRKSCERACRGSAWRFPVATPVTAALFVRVYPTGGGCAQADLGGARAWGAISSCLALGAVGGQFAASRVRPPARSAFVIGCLVPAMTSKALALGLTAPLAVVALAAALTGLAMGAQAVIFQTAVKANVSAGMLARVAAIDLVGSEGGQPIGYALAGPIAAAVGTRTLLTASALAMLTAATAFAFSDRSESRYAPNETPGTPRSPARRRGTRHNTRGITPRPGEHRLAP
jgi:hypothetical protein